MGLNGALVTLVAQAKGADKIALCGVYLNRARLVNTLCFFPLMFLVISCVRASYFEKFNYDAKVQSHAQAYIFYSMPGIYFLSMHDLIKRFLMCFKNVWVPMLIQIGATCLHIFLCHIFTDNLGWGLDGIGAAFTITSFTLLATTTIFAHL